MLVRTHFIAVSVVLVALVACGPGGDTRAPAGSYRPSIDPAKFSDRVTNRYMPLNVGTTYHYAIATDGPPETNEVTVTRAHKIIMGVRCVVVYDVVRRDGEIIEATYDWFAQDKSGNVWYFGEDSKAYSGGKVVRSTEGSWEAGVDGAQPGIVMPGHPHPGSPPYRQEYYKDHAEDLARVVRLDAGLRVPAGTYGNVLATLEFTPLEPGVVEIKYYAPGVGFVYGKTIKGRNEVTKLERISTS